MNATRQSLSETLTRAQRAFLTVADETAVAPDERPDQPGMIALVPNPSPCDGASEAPVARHHPTDNPTRRPEPLRSVTLRLRASVAEALRRESIRRSLDYVEPFSQQAIVEAAVRTWLQGQGCPLDE